MPIKDCSRSLSKLADETLAVMLPVAAKETARRAGQLEGDYAVLAMGKAGGRELSLASDLDVMVIYDAPAGSQTQFTKLTQRLVSAVSSVTAEGRLYELDMALRPSGRSGPVAVSLEAFKRYYDERAWTWEFMALTRARVMAVSSEAFSKRLETVLGKVMINPRADLDMPRDIADMLLRLRKEKPPRGPWDVKLIEGGARDIEFIAQSLYLARRKDYAGKGLTSTLSVLGCAQSLAQLSASTYDTLKRAHVYFADLTQYLTLTHGALSGNPDPAILSAIAKLMKFEHAEDLEKTAQDHSKEVSELLGQFIPL